MVACLRAAKRQLPAREDLYAELVGVARFLPRLRDTLNGNGMSGLDDLRPGTVEARRLSEAGFIRRYLDSAADRQAAILLRAIEQIEPLAFLDQRRRSGAASRPYDLNSYACRLRLPGFAEARVLAFYFDPEPLRCLVLHAFGSAEEMSMLEFAIVRNCEWHSVSPAYAHWLESQQTA